MKSTSIVTSLSEFKPEKSDKSLLQKIKEANSQEEIEDLIRLGSTFKNVSNKTMKMWAKEAAKKSKQF